MRRATTFAVVVLCSWIAGCHRQEVAAPVTPITAENVPPDAKAKFKDGLVQIAQHDRAGDWTAAACQETATLLMAAGDLASARYDAGLVARRCRQPAEARKMFEAALARDPSFYKAKVALALDAADSGKLDQAIGELRQAVIQVQFKDADALVALATLQMRRGSATADEDGPNDVERAKVNLHRALAIDDTNMAAMNQLALLHLDRAKRAPSKGAKKAATEALEMAALVCAQAVKKDQRFAPIHNTAGLIEVELGNLSRAAAEFDEARRLDPRLVEAHMNIAALNLQVRGFARAEQAYRAVLALRPDDYDARLGLSLAIRGQIDNASPEARVAEATKEIAAAKKIAPERPEAYFNEAILVQEYEARGAQPSETLAALAKAKALYQEFLAKADGAPVYADARERAKERLHDLEQMGEVVRSSTPVSKD